MTLPSIRGAGAYPAKFATEEVVAGGTVHWEVVFLRCVTGGLDVVHCVVVPLLELVSRTEGKAALKAREADHDLSRVDDDAFNRGVVNDLPGECVHRHLSVGGELIEVRGG